MCSSLFSLEFSYPSIKMSPTPQQAPSITITIATTYHRLYNCHQTISNRTCRPITTQIYHHNNQLWHSVQWVFSLCNEFEHIDFYLRVWILVDNCVRARVVWICVRVCLVHLCRCLEICLHNWTYLQVFEFVYTCWIRWKGECWMMLIVLKKKLGDT